MRMKLIPVMGTKDEISLIGVFNCFFLLGQMVELADTINKEMLENIKAQPTKELLYRFESCSDPEPDIL